MLLEDLGDASADPLEILRISHRQPAKFSGLLQDVSLLTARLEDLASRQKSLEHRIARAPERVCPHYQSGDADQQQHRSRDGNVFQALAIADRRLLHRALQHAPEYD